MVALDAWRHRSQRSLADQQTGRTAELLPGLAQVPGNTEVSNGVLMTFGK